MPLTGYSTSTISDVIYDTGVATIAGVPFGVTRGGLRVTIEEEWHEVEFDNRPAPIADLDRVMAIVTTITGTFLEFGATQIQHLLHDVAPVTAGGVSTWTPRNHRVFLAEGNYVEDLKFRVQRADESIVEFELDVARVAFALESADKSEAGITVTFVSRLERTVAEAP